MVGPSSSQAGIFVATTRGRDRNLAWIGDRTGWAHPGQALTAAIARPPNALTAHAVAARVHPDVSPAPEDDYARDIPQAPAGDHRRVPVVSCPSAGTFVSADREYGLSALTPERLADRGGAELSGSGDGDYLSVP